LAQGQEGDAAGGEFVQDGVGGEFGVEDQQSGGCAGDALPVLGEGDHFPCLFGFGEVGIGVDHLGGGVVLGEEGQYRSGPLGT
jgi:hypothetical protein